MKKLFIIKTLIMKAYCYHIVICITVVLLLVAENNQAQVGTVLGVAAGTGNTGLGTTAV